MKDQSKFNGRILRKKICEGIGISTGEYVDFIRKLYSDGMSGQEISEYIERETGEQITPRSVQRIVQKFGETRDIKTAFANAITKGRVVWQLEVDKKRRETNREQINRGLRYEILKRDHFACVLCGSKELLQVDHVVARINGGKSEEKNLRTLCLECNVGKRISEKEFVSSGKFVSGV